MFKFHLTQSELYDEQTFYQTFLHDVRKARTRIIIESPFITSRRFETLQEAIGTMLRRGVRVVVNTRNPDSHDPVMREQAMRCVGILQEQGVEVLYTCNLHRKIAIVDDVLWEGSLNILSQNDSCEMMRRTESKDNVMQMIRFTKLGRWYNQGKL